MRRDYRQTYFHRSTNTVFEKLIGHSSPVVGHRVAYEMVRHILNASRRSIDTFSAPVFLYYRGGQTTMRITSDDSIYRFWGKIDMLISAVVYNQWKIGSHIPCTGHFIFSTSGDSLFLFTRVPKYIIYPNHRDALSLYGFVAI